jgi:hypothetical protein
VYKCDAREVGPTPTLKEEKTMIAITPKESAHLSKGMSQEKRQHKAHLLRETRKATYPSSRARGQYLFIIMTMMEDKGA